MGCSTLTFRCFNNCHCQRCLGHCAIVLRHGDTIHNRDWKNVDNCVDSRADLLESWNELDILDSKVGAGRIAFVVSFAIEGLYIFKFIAPPYSIFLTTNWRRRLSEWNTVIFIFTIYKSQNSFTNYQDHLTNWIQSTRNHIALSRSEILGEEYKSSANYYVNYYENVTFI